MIVKDIINILKKADVDLKDAVYIGDSKTDIETAQNAGMDCIVVRWGYGNQKDYENDYILEAVDEFDDILNKSIKISYEEGKR